MPAEAATNVVNIIQFLYTPQNGSGAYAQHHAHFFGADFIVPLDERDDFLELKLEYLLEINNQHVSDSEILLQIRPQQN